MDSHMFDGLFSGLITCGIVIGLALAGVAWLVYLLVMYLVNHIRWI